MTTAAAPIGQAKIRIRPDFAGFREDVRAETDSATAKPGTVKVTADTAEAKARMDALRVDLDRLRTQTATARVRLDGDAKAQASLDKIDFSLRRLGVATARPKVSVEGAERAKIQLDEIEARLRTVGATTARPRVAVSGGEGGGGILNRLAAAGQGGFFGGRGLAIGALGAASVPVGIAGLGLGAGFLTPTVAGGTGLGLFGAATKSAVTRVDKVQQQIDAINKRIAQTSPTTTTGRGASVAQLQAAQQRLASAQVSGNPASIVAATQALSTLQAQGSTTAPNKAYEKLIQQRQALLNQLTPAERKAAEGTKDLEQAWVHFQRQLAPQSFKAVATGTDILTKGLKLALPLTKATGDEIDHLFKRADKALSDPFWRHFFNDFLAKEAPRAVDSLGTAIGNIVTGLAHLSEGWAPLGHTLETDLVNITNRFNQWTQGQGPGAFVKLVKQDGPVVAQAIQGIASGLVGVGKGLEPIGRIELQALTPVLDFIGTLGKQHPDVITALGVAYLGVAGGLKAIAAVKGVAGAAGILGGGGRAAGGKGILGGILGKATQQGSSPANPLYVFVVDKVPGGGVPKPPIITRIGKGILDTAKRYGPGLATDVGLPIAATGIALALTPNHSVLPGATVQAAQNNPAVMARYRQLLSQAESQSPIPVTADTRNRILAQAIKDIGAAAKVTNPLLHESTLQIAALNKVEALNPQLAKNLRQENVIVGKSFQDLATIASADGKNVGVNFGLGLIQGINAEIPHATVAGKLLVAATAKQIRLGLMADQAGAGSVVPKPDVVKKHAADAGTAAGTAYGEGVAGGITASVPVVSLAVDRLLAQVTAKFTKLQAKVANLQQQSTSTAQGITASLLGQTGIGALGLGVDSLGAPTTAPASAPAIITGLNKQETALDKFRAELRRERRRGLSGQAEQEIAALGLTQGGAVAAGLDHATRRQLRTISRLESQLHGDATGIGKDIAGQIFGQRIRELTDVVKEIRQFLTSNGHRRLTDADYQRLEQVLNAALAGNPVQFNDRQHRRKRAAAIRS